MGTGNQPRSVAACRGGTTLVSGCLVSSKQLSPELKEMPSILGGFIFTALSYAFILGVDFPGPEGELPTMLVLPVAVALFGPWVYWLYCVMKFHDAIWAVEGYRHPISSNEAVSLQLVPLANIWWSFRWPSEIARFVNWRRQEKAMRGWVAGLLVMAAALTTAFVWTLGAFFLFAAGGYISTHMRKAFAAAPVPMHARRSPVESVLGVP